MIIRNQNEEETERFALPESSSSKIPICVISLQSLKSAFGFSQFLSAERGCFASLSASSILRARDLSEQSSYIVDRLKVRLEKE